LPNTKTIFKFASSEEIKEESYKLAEEIIKECPHKDIELKISND
jgi:ferredoxin